MKFPGYVVSFSEGKVLLERCIFDETELTPESDWKHATFNRDKENRQWGGVVLDEALEVARSMSLAPPPAKPKINKSAELKNTLKSVYGDAVVAIGSLRNFDKAVRFECDKGHFWLATPNEVLDGKNCPKCGSRKLSHMARLFSRRGDVIKLVGEYINADTRTTYECGLCGDCWEIAPKNAYSERSVCPSCRGKK